MREGASCPYPFYMNIGHVITGWRNVFFRNDTIEDIAKRRLKVCSRCMDVPIGEIEKMKCKQCNCPLVAKARSPDDDCPLKLW